ncbi:MAG: adenylyltransferase/cytidyltransferase family protein [Simkaniaceae bacterium]|nr:adenylyltransferase/cytidyltransferase family protein [Candidatus Sacchlamyda saccharinae]
MLKSKLASFVFLFGVAFSSSSLMAAILDDTFEMTNFNGNRIGYYTGSFDPIHLGHQHVIDAALRNGYVDYVLVYPVPGGDNFKNRSELALRQKMLASIYQDNPKVFVTYWTPKELQNRFSQVTDNVEIIGIIGSDVVTEKLMGPDAILSAKYRKVFMMGHPLEEKHFYDSVGAIVALKASSFVVALRGGIELSYLNDKIYDRPILGFILSTGHSSTEVREAISNKQRFELFVSFPVQALIKREGMYGFSSRFNAYLQRELLGMQKEDQAKRRSLAEMKNPSQKDWERVAEIDIC